ASSGKVGVGWAGAGLGTLASVGGAARAAIGASNREADAVECARTERCEAPTGNQSTACATTPTVAPIAAALITVPRANRPRGFNSLQPMEASSKRPLPLRHTINPRRPAVRTSASFSDAVPGKFRRSWPQPRCRSMASIAALSFVGFINSTRSHSTDGDDRDANWHSMLFPLGLILRRADGELFNAGRHAHALCWNPIR